MSISNIYLDDLGMQIIISA